MKVKLPATLMMFLMHGFLLCDILFNSRIYQTFGEPLAQPVLLGTAAGILIVCLVIILFKRHLGVFLLAVAIFVLIVHQMLVFSDASKIDAQIGVFFQFLWAMSFILFYVLARAGFSEHLVETMVIYATGYTIIYLALGLLQLAGVLPTGLMSSITLTDVERGDRLFNYAATSAFAWFTWLSRAKRQPSAKAIVTLLVCAAAIVLSLSRVYILFLIFVTLLYLSRLTYSWIKRISVLFFVLAVAQNMAGLLSDDWNPYRFFDGDSSGSYRAMEYEIAKDLIFENPVFGFGIAPTQASAGILLDNDFFTASDLGPTGVWFDWGLPGLLMFFAGTMIAFRSRIALFPGNGPALFLTGCLLGLEGCLSPLIATGGATMFSLLLALWLADRGAGQITYFGQRMTFSFR